MIRPACIVVALGLATAGSTALAATAKPEPMMMTDAQMDDVTAGDLTVIIANSFNDWNVNNLTFTVNVIANVNTAIANGGDATAGQSVGTQTITTIVPTPTQTATQVTSMQTAMHAGRVHGHGK